MLRLLDGTPAEAKCLVSVGLWDLDGDGWAFHDWTDYNPDAASQKAKRDAESKGGTFGNHLRWHVKRKVIVPDCEWCNPSGTRSGGDQVPESGANPPDPTRPDPSRGSVGVDPTPRSNRGPDRGIGHIHEPNTRRALAALVADGELPLDVDELLAAAYRLGDGDPWAGYMHEVKPRCEQPLAGSRDPARVLRARLKGGAA
jgi:hypothetical protein